MLEIIVNFISLKKKFFIFCIRFKDQTKLRFEGKKGYLLFRLSRINKKIQSNNDNGSLTYFSIGTGDETIFKNNKFFLKIIIKT